MCWPTGGACCTRCRWKKTLRCSLQIGWRRRTNAPWERIAREDLARRVRLALARLSESDREVLLLRHIEGLDNLEIGYLLELAPKTVSKRHGRALLRLHAELAADGFEQHDL